MKKSVRLPLKIGVLQRAGLTTLAATLALLVAGCSDGSAQVNANPDPADGNDLRRGGVFAMSNAADANEVVAYARGADGTLSQVGFYPTGGSGSGSFEDSANALVLGTMAGEIAPNNLIESDDATQQMLFAANAGSNSISVLRVDAGGLVNVMTIDSRGEKPVSVTVNNSIVYVLNSGVTNDALFDGNGNVIPNCATGLTPTITGFRLAGDGTLTSIAGSERELSGELISGCAQLSFTPDGSRLVVTERLAQPAELGRVAVPYDAALRPKIVSAKAQGAGRSHSAAKLCNAGWRDFGPQPPMNNDGTAAIFPQYRVAARLWCSATRRSLRLVLQKNSRRRGAA
jgi:hypothetical protein